MQLKNRYITKWRLLVMISILVGQGCKKAVEVSSPNTNLIGSTVYTDPKTATAVMTGVYDNMHSVTSFSDGNAGISNYMGIAADEMKNYFQGLIAVQFYTNSLISTNSYFWPQFFQYIYVSNTVIQNIDSSSSSLTTTVKAQLKGEALFMRAFLHFYATNLYGDIPVVTSTDYTVNNAIRRSPQSDVYKAIIADLITAQSLLTDDYMDASNLVTSEKIRPNKTAATALLARAYLYAGDYKNAELQATAVISNSNYSLMSDMNGVFLKNSAEAIWQLASPNPTITNTIDGYYNILKGAPTGNSHISLSTFLINAFESGDNRKANWVGSVKKGTTTYYYPYKYKNNQSGLAPTEYLMILRVGEQYLIRAEARAQLSESNAISDINAIRHRAGLNNYNGATDKNSLLAAILHERQTELFSEWGHRWFDLKRTGNLDAVMGGPSGVCAAKGGVWKSTSALLPIPVSETLINPNLTPNPGY